MLTDAQKKKREGKLTASSISCLMTGDTDRILNLWKMLVGDPSYIQQNFDDNWPVQFGEATEEINLRWFSKRHGPLSRHGEVVIHPSNLYCCTLDAWSDKYQCPVEAKSVGGFEKTEVVIQRYMPQIQFQMLLTGVSQAAISIIEGGREPLVEFIPRDEAYISELWTRAEQFMAFVRTLTPPIVLPPVQPPQKPTREIDMATNNAWVSAAADWLETKMHADKHETAKSTIKDLVPSDAVRAFGSGVEAKRDRANRLKIVEMREKK